MIMRGTETTVQALFKGKFGQTDVYRMMTEGLEHFSMSQTGEYESQTANERQVLKRERGGGLG